HAAVRPADTKGATQQMADALTATIGAAPEQWYSFKPIWPPTDEEAAELAHQADRMLAGDRSAVVPLGVGSEAPVAAPPAQPDPEAAPTPAPLAGTEFGPS